MSAPPYFVGLGDFQDADTRENAFRLFEKEHFSKTYEELLAAAQ
jgi:hypothetical protein